MDIEGLGSIVLELAITNDITMANMFLGEPEFINAKKLIEYDMRLGVASNPYFKNYKSSACERAF